MAAALEFYFNETRTPANFTGAYSTFLTCTANRTGKAGSKNFFIICHISTTVDNTGTLGKVRLQVDSTDYGEVADGLTHGAVSPHGYTYNFCKRLSLDNSSHSITLDCGRVSGANNFVADNASIVILEESANAQYWEKEVEEGTGSGTGNYYYLQETFTPLAATKYICIFSAEIMCEDESNVGIGGAHVRVWQASQGGVALLNEGWGELVAAANDNIYRTLGGMVVYTTTDTADLELIIVIKGNGVDDEMYARKGYMIAIPVSDFENAYSDSQTTKTFHTTSQTDTGCVLATQACNAADHLVIASAEVSNETFGDAGFIHLISAGSVDFPAYNLDDRDEDASEYYMNFLVHGVTLAADDYDFEIEGDSSSDSNEGCVAEAHLAVCEIPAGVAAVYKQQVIMIN